MKCICGNILREESTYCNLCGAKVIPAVPKDMAREILAKQGVKSRNNWTYIGLLISLFLVAILLLIYRFMHK